MATTLETLRRFKESQSNNNLQALRRYKAKIVPPTVSPEIEQKILGSTLSTKDMFDKVNTQLNLSPTLKPTQPLKPGTKQRLLSNNLSVKSIFDKVNQNLGIGKEPTLFEKLKAPTGNVEMRRYEQKLIQNKYKNIPNYKELPAYQHEVTEFLKKYPEAKFELDPVGLMYDPEKTKTKLPYLGEKAKSGLMSVSEGYRNLLNLKDKDQIGDREDAIYKDIRRQRQEFQKAEAENVIPALKLGGDVIEGITRMIPTIMAGAANPGMALAQMGLSVAGNSAQEALDKGATREQALTYGILSGSLEAAVESLVGGLPFLKGIGDKAIQSALKPIKSKIARVLAGRVIDAGGEALEEVISGVVDPYLRRATFDKNAEFPKLQELMYEAGVAGLISGALGVPSTISQLRQPGQITETQPETLQQPIEKQTLKPIEQPQEIARPAQPLLSPYQKPSTEIKTPGVIETTGEVSLIAEKPKLQAVQKPVQKEPWEMAKEKFIASPPEGYKYKSSLGDTIARVDSDNKIILTDAFFNHNNETKREIIAHEQAHSIVAKFVSPEYSNEFWDVVNSGLLGKYNPEKMKFESVRGGRNAEETLTQLVTDIKLGDFNKPHMQEKYKKQYEFAQSIIDRFDTKQVTEQPTKQQDIEKPTLKPAKQETLQQQTQELIAGKQPTKETAIKDVQNKINELETEIPKLKINLQLFAKKRIQKYKKLLDDLQKKGVNKANIEEVKKLMDVKDSIADLKREWKQSFQLQQKEQDKRKGYKSFWEKAMIKKEAGEKLRLRLKTQKKELTQKFKLKEAKQKEQLEQSRLKAVERKAVNKEVRGMIDKLKKVGSKLKYMRPEYRNKIRDLLYTIDYKVKYRTETKLEQLTKLKQYIEDNPDNNIPDYVLKDLDILSKKSISEIGLEEFKSIYNAVMHLVHLEKLKNTLIWGQKYKSAREVSDEAVSNVLKDKQILVDSAIIDTSKPEYRGNLLTDYYYDSLNPETLTFMSDNKSDGIIKKVLYDDFLEGYEEQLTYKSEAYKIFQDFLENLGNDIRTWSRHFNKNIKDYVEINISDGRKIKMTKAERAYIYAATFDKDALRSMIKGGISTKNNLSQVFKLSEADIKVIENSMSKEEKEFVQLTQEYFTDFAADKMNERFLELNGYELIPEKKGYIPIYRHSDYVNKDTLKPRGKTINATLEGIGYLKERVKASKPIVIEDMFRVLVDHIEKISAYYGMAKPLRNAKMLMSDIDFKNAYRRTGQEAIYKQLGKYLKDVEDNSTDLDFIDKLSYNILNKFSTYALGANPFTVLKQYTAYALEAGEINPKYLLKAQFTKSDLDEIKKYSPILADRIEGNASLELGEIGKVSRLRRLFGNYKSIPQILTKGIVMADQNIIAKTWNAVKMEIKDTTNLKGEEFIKKVAKRTEEIIRKTNSSSTIFDRSAIGRMKHPAMKAFIMFTSQTNVMLNSAIRTITEYNQSNKTAGDFLKLAKKLSLTLIIATLLEQGVDKLRNRLKGKEEKQSLVLDLIEGLFDKLYILGPAFKVFRSGIERGKYFGFDYSIPTVQAVNELIHIGLDLYDTIDKMKTKEVYVSGDKKGQLKWKQSAKTLTNSIISITGKFTGIPVDQIKGIGQMLTPKEEPDKPERVKIERLKKPRIQKLRLKKP